MPKDKVELLKLRMDLVARVNTQRKPQLSDPIDSIKRNASPPPSQEDVVQIDHINKDVNNWISILADLNFVVNKVKINQSTANNQTRTRSKTTREDNRI